MLALNNSYNNLPTRINNLKTRNNSQLLLAIWRVRIIFVYINLLLRNEFLCKIKPAYTMPDILDGVVRLRRWRMRQGVQDIRWQEQAFEDIPFEEKGEEGVRLSSISIRK